MRSPVLIGSVLSAVLAFGCNTARDQQEKADRAQAEANDKIAEANQQAQEKVNEAQAEADKKTAEAQADFTKIREDFRHDINTKLADIDKKIADMEAKAKTETAQKKVSLDAKISDIRSSREAFASEYRNIDTVTALSWDDFKKRVDKSLDDLESKVERA
jgi:regulator of protease activity HflC (stomatin/prohibitin superfamily)